jgi:uncharacterized protein YndB with AHSA1/START domain
LKTIHHVFDTTAPRDTVFAALTTTQGLSGWWTTIVKAEAGVGAVVRFTFAGDFNPGMHRAQVRADRTREMVATPESGRDDLA